MSFSGTRVFLEIEAYCDYLILANKEKVTEIIGDYKRVIQISLPQKSVDIRSVHLGLNNSGADSFLLGLLAVIFVIIVFMSLPWFLLRSGT
ncbi:MAG: hypothetical protein PUP46_09855 [Endozoicomonas sp. (ex Botrylloides leachii)]|nr:hypothetical protein [Endozoicomonas sp. (ex Botrylloides leachii)]